jgi:hypothetical protein
MDIVYFSACDNGFLVGAGAAREVRAYDRNGKLMHTVRVTREPTILSGASRTAMIENWAGVHPRPGERPTEPKAAAAFAKAFDAAVPRNMTFVEQFSIGADRSLWLAPGKEVQGWQRLDRDGAGKPVLELPKGAWPVFVTSRFVLAKWYGDDERVELWPRPRATDEPAHSALAFLGTCRTMLIQ